MTVKSLSLHLSLPNDLPVLLSYPTIIPITRNTHMIPHLPSRTALLAAVLTAGFLIPVITGDDSAAEPDAATQLTKDTFEEELKTANYFVKFYAPW